MPMGDWESHIGTFFNELFTEQITGFMQENEIPLEQLAKVFATLPEVFQEPNFKGLLEQHG
jgi:hypothetical protein